MEDLETVKRCPYCKPLLVHLATALCAKKRRAASVGPEEEANGFRYDENTCVTFPDGTVLTASAHLPGSFLAAIRIGKNSFTVGF